jgi:hypothetical protein
MAIELVEGLGRRQAAHARRAARAGEFVLIRYGTVSRRFPRLTRVSARASSSEEPDAEHRTVDPCRVRVDDIPTFLRKNGAFLSVKVPRVARLELLRASATTD